MKRQNGVGSVFQRADGLWVASRSVGPRSARRILRRYAKSRERAEELLTTLPVDAPQTPEERFWSIPSGCLEWPLVPRNAGGYGLFFLEGSRQIASRVAWRFTRGRVPDGLNVLHRCDNPPCVEPEHLFLGTQADNVADMDAKGRRRSQGALPTALTAVATENSEGDSDRQIELGVARPARLELTTFRSAT